MNKEKIKILLVDNNEMMRIYFRDIFWINGRSDTYDISVASSLEEAEKMVEDKNTTPDTVFLDVLTPYQKGGKTSSYDAEHCLEFVKKIKKDNEIKVIVYSGQKEELLKEISSHLGADGYLTKGELMPKEVISFTDKIHGANN